jgi:hypothetical protein
MCKPVPIHNTTGEYIVNLIDLYMAEKGLSWKQRVDICTDGALSMVGKTRSFIAHVKAIAPECASSHWIIHCQTLAVKEIPNALKTMLDEVVKIENVVESRMFSVLCDEMDSSCTTLLLQTEFPWLSRGRAGSCIHNALRNCIQC